MDIKVEGRPDLVRDSSTGAIINTNNTRARSALLRAEKARKERQEIEELKNDVAEIKSLLTQLLEK